MTKLLITNDDGIDAPALVPLAKAMEQVGEVTVVAPSGERSWIGKAISRVGSVAVRRELVEGYQVWSVGGFPADCVQIGSHGILDSPPDLVISGINIGSNRGSAFATGSGTLGAAVEASNLGIPGLAFSAASEGEWSEWVEWVRTDDALEMWYRLAALAADITTTVAEFGMPQSTDVLSINFPARATAATPRRITALARTRYGGLFSETNGLYHHDFDGVLHVDGDYAGSDMAALDAGEIAITPIRMATSTTLDGPLRDRLARS